ncbi:Neuropeptide-Like Protein [Caenorhabditis elegans]|uniref:Neuropeptide-Like Protein n=1 Tax=Caenorhabditis elegans TaxID=6239 RepID=U4PAL5_CAEEL|nr:Neuropeptide-Like Protein [Caenorhabditis elegans]CDH92938.1 Neuropeptide-Like Protein [Caenorhabditis elegans]|eukprot:NP_001293533.1 Neuropeptide-Like Protein [Caenorhabditis elegans]
MDMRTVSTGDMVPTISNSDSILLKIGNFSGGAKLQERILIIYKILQNERIICRRR